MPRRRTQPIPRWLRGALRLFSSLVVMVFVCQSTLAWAFPCCGDDDCAEAGEAVDHEGSHPGDHSCPCPIDCSPCCSGHAAPALSPVAPSFDLPGDAWTEIAESETVERP